MTNPTTTPAAAAERLRELLTALGDNRGPWYIENEEARPYPQEISNKGVPYVVATAFTDPSVPPHTARYIAAMNPRVGAAVADWLGCQAQLSPEEREGAACGWCGQDHAAVVSRALLGEGTRR